MTQRLYAQTNTAVHRADVCTLLVTYAGSKGYSCAHLCACLSCRQTLRIVYALPLTRLIIVIASYAEQRPAKLHAVAHMTDSDIHENRPRTHMTHSDTHEGRPRAEQTATSKAVETTGLPMPIQGRTLIRGFFEGYLKLFLCEIATNAGSRFLQDLGGLVHQVLAPLCSPSDSALGSAMRWLHDALNISHSPLAGSHPRAYLLDASALLSDIPGYSCPYRRQTCWPFSMVTLPP